jgi:hypothetical protein
MKDWMATVYQQQPKPSNFTGVNIQLTALDSNNNWQDLGTVTTDSKGKYSLTYTPAISGDYQVFANFAGTNGFWPSSDETTFNVMNAAPTASPYPVTVLPPTEMYVTAAAVAIIVAMAIIGAVIVLVLRKRP